MTTRVMERRDSNHKRNREKEGTVEELKERCLGPKSRQNPYYTTLPFRGRKRRGRYVPPSQLPAFLIFLACMHFGVHTHHLFS